MYTRRTDTRRLKGGMDGGSLLVGWGGVGLGWAGGRGALWEKERQASKQAIY